MVKFLYCFEHEEVFPVVSTEACPLAHDLGVITYVQDGAVVIESNYCCFDEGFAVCPPPDEFFIRSNKGIPCPDEMDQLNQSAVELSTSW